MTQITRILKEIHVYVDYVEARDTQFMGMDMRTRFICNFLERKIKPLRFKTPGFSSICVVGRSSPSDECLINSCNVICVDLPFDVRDYNELPDDELVELSCSMLRSGFEKCNSQFPIPLSELVDALDEFRDLGYVNRWTHCSKLARGFGYRWTLNCTFTMHEFWLDLIVSRDDDEIFKEEIFRTRGDEFAWVPLFKDAKHKDGTVQIWGADRQFVYEFDLATLTGARTEFLESWDTI